ncbi:MULTISPECIES: hypothetical protein [unclassified Oceanobacter]|jgi:hypothetical protein|uniref:hypothetical protein n=1 Tax=unclassified Oceanobacter TaxID=2620260 RepID=UPI002736178C|nr:MULTISPECIES: hypothetical protein [unclassified Oceanobacter]MDP2506030.1 hypothetical protein [Oceanobacter sp. 3_MG-2023]MDP2547609.1 hypothetical protein [Oceanobacter sp. 4_MG-2023]MDP2608983.1 hypothetical protein [Oceanobacter sp. 1_MG-2023]MDP2612032.1 hypothetical protein [Oceanobacter sp. 2_MG-2023]
MEESTVRSPAQARQGSHTFQFEKFSIRGATHKNTQLTVFPTGEWKSVSSVSTHVASFKPRISLSVEFFLRDAGMVIPVGNVPEDWSPKHLWSTTFAKLEDRVIHSSGKSEFIANQFETLVQHAEGKLKLRLQHKQGFLGRFF